MTLPSTLYDDLLDEISTVIVGNEEIVEQLTISLLNRGHVLLEGVPGVAKTTIANLFAQATGLSYARIQLTPDLLPADVVGTHIYKSNTERFEAKRGPIFANVVVADEINRATPKTQSAFLEAMEERRVTIEGESIELPDPFIVIATRNPLEMEGVYELPEAQRDRFQFKLTVNIPDKAGELELMDRFDDDPTISRQAINQVVDAERILDAQSVVDEVHVADQIKEYIRQIVAKTRSHPDIEYGGSPRATLALMNGAKAKASISGREYVIPDDVKRLTVPTLTHRVALTTDAELSERSVEAVIKEVTQGIAAPGGKTEVLMEDQQTSADKASMDKT